MGFNWFRLAFKIGLYSERVNGLVQVNQKVKNMLKFIRKN